MPTAGHSEKKALGRGRQVLSNSSALRSPRALTPRLNGRVPSIDQYEPGLAGTSSLEYPLFEDDTWEETCQAFSLENSGWMAV